MTGQILDRVLICYRIGDPNGTYPIFDATGSKLYPGRWNTSACPMIYAAEHYSTAMLEKLVHGSGSVPPNQHYIEITIPPGVSYEVLNVAALPDWFEQAGASSKRYGDEWQTSRRSLILLVPSVVARIERNVLINPEHPDFPRIATSLHQPVWWDSRLFAP
ncbi:MAG: RES family NAD+ phosphorylase [Gemmatimonas sp.]